MNPDILRELIDGCLAVARVYLDLQEPGANRSAAAAVVDLLLSAKEKAAGLQ